MKTRLACALLVAMLAGLGVVAVPSVAAAQQADDGDHAEVRIVAQRLDDDRIEFALQQRGPDDTWGERLLPDQRFFPAGAEVGRWLVSSPLVLTTGNSTTGVPDSSAAVEVRIVAQRLSSGRTEFALQQRAPDDIWGERLLPERRFFPARVEVGRWLASSPLELQIVAGTTDSGPVDTAQGTGSPPEEHPEQDDPPAEGDEQSGAVSISADVPDFDMVDVHSGETVNLRSVVTGETPLLFWLWSPY